MGNMVYLAASSKSGSTNLLPILIIVVLFGVLYMTMIRPQRNRQRNAQQMQNTVMPGARIRTTAGIYGTVKSIEDGDVVVEVAPGVNIRMLRRAVAEVVQDGGGVNGAGANGSGPAHEPTQDEHESETDDWNPKDQKNV